MEETFQDEEVKQEVIVNVNKVKEAEVVNEMEELEENEDLIRDCLEESV